MKKKVFGSEDIKSTRINVSEDWLMSMHLKTGQLLFNLTATEGLMLWSKLILFIQDDDNPKNWYIEITHDLKSGIKCVKKDNIAKFNSMHLIDLILESQGKSRYKLMEQGVASYTVTINKVPTPGDKLFPLLLNTMRENSKRTRKAKAL